MKTDRSPDDFASKSVAAAPRCRLLDAVLHGIQENDLGGVITFSNRAHHDMLGYEDGELVCRKIWDLQPCEEAQTALRAAFEKNVTEQPTPVPYITFNRRKDGSIIDLQIDWNYLRNEDGSLWGFAPIISDVTEQNRRQHALAEQSRGLAALLDASRRLSASLDLEKILQSAADGVTELVGLDTAAVYLIEESFVCLKAAYPPLPPGFPEDLRRSARKDHPHIELALTSGEPQI